MRRLLVAALCAAVGSCSSNKEVTPEQACVDLPPAICAASKACCGRGDFDEPKCVERWSALCSAMKDGVSQGAVLFDGAKVGTCVDGLRKLSAPCQGNPGFSPWNDAVPECASIFAGNVQEGGTCDLARPCAGDMYCAFNAASSTGTCTKPAAANASCVSSGVCVDGHYCDFSANVCRPESGVGGPCSHGSGCVEGAYCEGTTCQAKRAFGTPCSSDAQCQSSLCSGTCLAAQNPYCVGYVASCGAQNCGSGCCAQESCRAGNEIAACGANGGVCRDCASTVQHASGLTCAQGSCGYTTCDAGYGNCDGQASNGCETATNAEPNCGGCGIVCANTVQHATGAACSTGACDYAACEAGWLDCDGDRSNGCEAQACTLVPYGGNELTVDGSELFWVILGGASGPAVQKVGLGGGTVTTLASNQDTPKGIAVDTLNVYWTAAGSNSNTGVIARVAKSGGSVTTYSTTEDSPWGIAVDATNVYWTNWSAGELRTVSIGGGTPSTLASGLTMPTALTIDALNVYVVTNGSVVRVAKAGGTPAPVGASSGLSYGVALDGAYVYWTNDSGVARALADGTGSSELVVSASGFIRGLLVEASNIYLTVFGDGVYRAPKAASSAAVRIADNQGAAWGIVQSGANVYWTNGTAILYRPK